LDKQFLEFWGNLLLSVARGQRQLEELTRWTSQGMSGFHDLNAMFRQIYGLDSERSGGEDKDWKTARNSFEKAYRAYLDMLGVVPKSDYMALKKQLEELQEKVEDQLASMRKLRLELSQSRTAQGDVVRGFRELIQVQSEQFHELTDSFSRFFADRGSNKIEGTKP
jgi:hypothetical protein